MKKVLRSFALTGMILIILSAFFTACEQPSGSSTEPTDAVAPKIGTQPTGGAWDVSAKDTFTATVTAAVTDGGTLSYQWYSNTSATATGGTAISGQTQETLTLAKTAYATNGARYFYVIVTNTLADNGDGGRKTASVTSAAITVTVSGNAVAGAVNAAEPTISAQPAGGAWNVATAATFDMTVAATTTDSGTISYQWYSNTSASVEGGTLLVGKTEPTLTLATADYQTVGDYYFYAVVSNKIEDNGDGGTKTATATSDPVTVTVVVYEEAPQSVKEALAGTWAEPYSTYTIDATTFQSGTAWGGYGGTIEKVRIRQGSSDEGYITIKYTYNDDAANAAGRYYVIHFQNLTASGMDISGAYNGDDPDFGASGFGGGKETLEAAEAAFTMSNGVYEFHTAITKIGGGDLETPVPEGLINTWQGEGDNYYTMEITDEMVKLTYTMPDDGPYVSDNFTASIVNVRWLSPESGYITLYYDVSGAGANQGKYGVMYYQKLNADTSVNMVVAANSPSGWGNSSKDTAEEAETTYVWTVDAEVEGGGYLVNNNGNKRATLIAFTPEE